MRTLISALSVVMTVLLLQSGTPAQASGVPTYTTLGGSNEGGHVYLAGILDSGDQRCLYGRRMHLQEKIDGVYETVATDTTTSSQVGGFRILPTANPLRVKVPAKTLSDGTRCAAGTVMPMDPIRVGGARPPEAARGIVSVDLHYAGLTTIGTFGFVGEISGLGVECRKGRTVKYQVDLGIRMLTISKDVTGKNGVFGLGGELPLAPIRVYVPAKTVGDMECAPLSAEISL